MASTPRFILPAHIVKLQEQDTPEEQERRPTTPHMSFSQLSMYLRCSMQYYFRYILGMKDRPKVSLSIGKGGHEALEWNTKTKIKTGEDAPEEAVIQRASDFIDHYLRELPPSEYEKDVEPGETKDKYLSATRVFRKRDAPKIKPIGAEVEFNLDLNEFDPEPLPEPIRVVNGKIDLLSDDTETVIVTSPDIIRVAVDDYKFVSRKRSQEEVNLSPQLTLYGTVVKKLTGKWPTKLGYKQMHPGTTKEPPNSIPLLRDPALMTPEALTARMRRLVYQFRKAEEGIRAGIFVPTDDPKTCSWCGFRDRCQMSLVDDFEAATIRAQT